MITVDEWLTIKEASARLKVSVPTLRKYIRMGVLPHYRQGRIVRLKIIDIDSFLHPGIEPEQRRML